MTTAAPRQIEAASTVRSIVLPDGVVVEQRKFSFVARRSKAPSPLPFEVVRKWQWRRPAEKERWQPTELVIATAESIEAARALKAWYEGSPP